LFGLGCYRGDQPALQDIPVSAVPNPMLAACHGTTVESAIDSPEVTASLLLIQMLRKTTEDPRAGFRDYRIQAL
jgi:hypothetical protein